MKNERNFKFLGRLKSETELWQAFLPLNDFPLCVILERKMKGRWISYEFDCKPRGCTIDDFLACLILHDILEEDEIER